MDPIFEKKQKNNSPEKQSKPRKSLGKTILKSFLIFFLVLILLVGTTAAWAYTSIYLPAKVVMDDVAALKLNADNIKTSLSTKDLNKIKAEISFLKKTQNKLETDYKRLSVLSSFPYARDYYQDGLKFIDILKQSIETGEIVISAVEPYKDFLGLQGSSSSASKTTEDRISFLTDSVESILPHLNTIETKIANIEKDLDQIDPDRYPEEYKGVKIQSTLMKAKSLVSQIHKLVKDDRPFLEKTPWLLGKDTPRQYFLLFQNDGELRPSGGFWTAYGILKVSKGKVTPVISDDIYSLDARLNSTIPAPRPIKAYHINVPYWNLRDMNISPDFPTDVGYFLEQYSKISKEKFDAIIAIDTQVLVDLVKVLGRIGVPGWGNFSADPDKRCDGCPQIIYQLEWIAGRPRNYIEKDRKGFLAPLMHSLLANAMGSPKEKMAPLFESMVNNLNEKHILFYFKDPEMQNAATLANLTGSISAIDKNTDYFHLNDSNMASAKTNIFLTQKIKHEIISKEGKVEHKVSVTYTNPSKASNCNLEKGDLCLNAPKYRDWFRFYTPTGSTLVKMTGSEVEPVLYEELGKQVFEGFYGNKYPLYAQSSSKVSIQYVSSVPAGADYTLLLQKQPGTKPVEYELIVNGQPSETFLWNSDKTIKLAL